MLPPGRAQSATADRPAPLVGRVHGAIAGAPLLMRPVLATVLIFNLIYVFNEYPFASVLIDNPQMTTISLAVSQFQGQYSTNYGAMMAASTIILIPQLAIYAVFQRHVIAGMTVGAVKG